MNFAIISPTSGLQRYSTLSKTHLVLAHECKNMEYLNFYRERSEAGDTVILDNGAHEQGSSSSWNLLEQTIMNLRPQICVLPDTLNNPVRTASDSLRFLDKNSQRFPQIEWMYVVQATNGTCIPELLSRVLGDARVGPYIKWLGITRYLSITHGLSRVNIKKMLQGYGKKFHALGMVQGSISELLALEKAGFDSVDSSVPVWRGRNHYRIGDLRWPEIPVDFSAESLPSGSPTDIMILDNLTTCLEAANADTTELRRLLSGSEG